MEETHKALAEHWAEQAAKRAFERCMVELGREPTGAEAVLMHLQMQVAVLTSMLAPSDRELASFWERVTAAAMDGARETQ